MKKTSTTNVLRLSLAALAIAGVQTAQAAWEQVWAHPTTQAHIITSKGTFLISDYDDNRKGGIFFSEDKGKTWKQTEVKDFNYHKFYEADGYVYALSLIHI